MAIPRPASEWSHIVCGSQSPMQARTKGTSARTPWGHLQPPMRRRVPAGAFSRACTVVKVIFPASLTRRGSAERPRDGSPRPTAESGLDIVNRCMVFQDVASDGASIDGTFAMPTVDRGRLDQQQRFPPPRPQPSQKQPEQTVRWANAPIRTSEYAQLVAQGKILEQEVSTRRQG